MGKLTVKQAEELVEKGILNKDTLETMQTEGIVSSRRNSTRRFIKTADGTWVSPTLYFAGLKGAVYSKEMNELREKINNLIDSYTVVRQNNK
jgi:hypothetical protein